MRAKCCNSNAYYLVFLGLMHSGVIAYDTTSGPSRRVSHSSDVRENCDSIQSLATKTTLSICPYPDAE
ncbi:hypothetical protein M413DRAFT_442712 [Hebeloma cylindrosporum]|uniref:Secreted protein n=1 Tax=Hebeloma cylindrosporum TaxID=76867 RepID=A0A0C2Y4H4_HEBCY|nr:hypothetical protein M413DRAFT_442712 [Hebeloma cylindrosporum h7]